MELQGKMQETNQKLRIADVQVESLKKQIVHAQLTDKEIQVGISTTDICRLNLIVIILAFPLLLDINLVKHLFH